MNVQSRFLQWKEQVKDGLLQKELSALSESQIKERFYKELSFGTGGLRGVLGVGTACLNIYTVARITRGVAAYIKRNALPYKVAISYDSRINSRLFAETAARVLASDGVSAVLTKELMPTPFLSYLTRETGAGLGIMITASHNPKEYNGYKVYGADGCQLTDGAANAVAAEISAFGYFEEIGKPFEEYLANGQISYADERVEKSYLNEIKKLSSFPLDSLSLVYTPLHGTGYRLIPKLLKEKGIGKIVEVEGQNIPNGEFPTCPAPNPEKAEALTLGIKTLEQSDCDLLLATDPDADRIGVVVKEKDGCRLLTGNETGALLCEYILSVGKETGTLPACPVVVKTVVTTDLVKEICKDYGAALIETLTGFKYIGEQVGRLEKQKDVDFVFGLEESYGYLTQTFVRDKDAVSAALKIAEMAAYYKTQGKTLADKLEELYARYGRFENKLLTYSYLGADGAVKLKETVEKLRSVPPQTLGGKKVVQVYDYLTGKTGLPKTDMLCFTMEDGSKTLVRPSGTEPLVKAYLFVRGDEKTNAETLNKLQADLNRLLGNRN